MWKNIIFTNSIIIAFPKQSQWECKEKQRNLVSVFFSTYSSIWFLVLFCHHIYFYLKNKKRKETNKRKITILLTKENTSIKCWTLKEACSGISDFVLFCQTKSFSSEIIKFNVKALLLFLFFCLGKIQFSWKCLSRNQWKTLETLKVMDISENIFLEVKEENFL